MLIGQNAWLRSIWINLMDEFTCIQYTTCVYRILWVSFCFLIHSNRFKMLMSSLSSPAMQQWHLPKLKHIIKSECNEQMKNKMLLFYTDASSCVAKSSGNYSSSVHKRPNLNLLDQKSKQNEVENHKKKIAQYWNFMQWQNVVKMRLVWWFGSFY